MASPKNQQLSLDWEVSNKEYDFKEEQSNCAFLQMKPCLCWTARITIPQLNQTRRVKSHALGKFDNTMLQRIVLFWNSFYVGYPEYRETRTVIR